MPTWKTERALVREALERYRADDNNNTDAEFGANNIPAEAQTIAKTKTKTTTAGGTAGGTTGETAMTTAANAKKRAVGKSARSSAPIGIPTSTSGNNNNIIAPGNNNITAGAGAGTAPGDNTIIEVGASSVGAGRKRKASSGTGKVGGRASGKADNGKAATVRRTALADAEARLGTIGTGGDSNSNCNIGGGGYDYDFDCGFGYEEGSDYCGYGGGGGAGGGIEPFSFWRSSADGGSTPPSLRGSGRAGTAGKYSSHESVGDGGAGGDIPQLLSLLGVGAPGMIRAAVAGHPMTTMDQPKTTPASKPMVPSKVRYALKKAAAATN